MSLKKRTGVCPEVSKQFVHSNDNLTRNRTHTCVCRPSPLYSFYHGNVCLGFPVQSARPDNFCQAAIRRGGVFTLQAL